MRLKYILAISALVVIGLLVLQQSLGREPELRNWEFFPEMVRSSAYGSQSENPHFQDGMTQRDPVPGTIPRGHLPFSYGDSLEERDRAGRELKNPIGAAEDVDLARGEAVYRHHCQVCHGANGEGRTPVTQRGFPRPPSLRSERAKSLSDGEIFHLVTLGVRAMPPYGNVIAPLDNWRLITHLRRIQEQQ